MANPKMLNQWKLTPERLSTKSIPSSISIPHRFLHLSIFPSMNSTSSAIKRLFLRTCGLLPIAYQFSTPSTIWIQSCVSLTHCYTIVPCQPSTSIKFPSQNCASLTPYYIVVSHQPSATTIKLSGYRAVYYLQTIMPLCLVSYLPQPLNPLDIELYITYFLLYHYALLAICHHY